MAAHTYSYFVVAAVIAARLDKATRIARHLSITASNARALAFRAGEGASGFRPLTDYIHRLADLTVSSSSRINHLASELSRTAAEKERAERALRHFVDVGEAAKDSPFIDSLQPVFDRTSQRQRVLRDSYNSQIKLLASELDTLDGELRAAGVLATMSRVEALQADGVYQQALNNVADNVESVTASIKKHIQSSQKLVQQLTQEFS
ncbi:MAG: hypothetical protein KC477_03035 [Oceanospirillaceae bacterium]|nr:hypothetical protein [Oceanospirillaceae bacterium]